MDKEKSKNNTIKKGRPFGTTTGSKSFQEKQYRRIEKITTNLLKQVENDIKKENDNGLSLDEKREFAAKLDTLKILFPKVMADSKSSHKKEDEIQIVLDE